MSLGQNYDHLILLEFSLTLTSLKVYILLTSFPGLANSRTTRAK